MDLTPTSDQDLITSTAREFLADRFPAAAVRAAREHPDGHPVELWKEMVELGWMGLALPEAHGGAGAGFLELCLVIEEMGRRCLPGPFVPSVACVGLPIVRFGTDEQQARLLPAVAEGRIMTYVPAATGGGWAGRGGLEATPDGDGWVLDGDAMFVPYAHVASDLLVVAPLSGQAGSSVAVLVDAAADGLTSQPLETVGPDRLCRVSFRAVRVRAPERVGGADGAAVAAAADALGAAATCARMVGGAEQVLEMTVGYARDREQFGRPIGSFQAVQHHCADMAIDVLSSRFIAYEAIWRLSAGLDADTEVAMAKAWVSEASRRVAALGHQVHGAIGFTAEHDLSLYLRQATAFELTFGDAEVHYARVADLIGVPPGAGSGQ